ncbi:hypothetical protein KKC00_01485 [Patescibacteria group bacterium]|nr:hypothetical protein [Patescibacteria group bacterium]
MYILAKIIDAVKKCRKYQKEISLIAIVFLLMLLSFALGYIAAKYPVVEPIQFIEKT